MSALAGGGADKLGNRYEHWWVAGRMGEPALSVEVGVRSRTVDIAFRWRNAS